jgi:hypothetical protein
MKSTAASQGPRDRRLKILELMSREGHSRHFDRAPITSGLPLINGHSQSPSACLRGANNGSQANLVDHFVGRGEKRWWVLMPSVFALVGLMARSKWWVAPPEDRLVSPL